MAFYITIVINRLYDNIPAEVDSKPIYELPAKNNSVPTLNSYPR